MKLFRTSDISVIAYCREMFQFDLLSAILKKRAEKFDSVCHLTDTTLNYWLRFRVSFWFIVSFYIMHASTYG